MNQSCGEKRIPAGVAIVYKLFKKMFQYCSFLIRFLKQSSNSIFRLIAFGLYLIFYFYTLIGHLLKKLRHHRVGRPMETKVAGWRPLLAELCLLFDFFFFNFH